MPLHFAPQAAFLLALLTNSPGSTAIANPLPRSEGFVTTSDGVHLFYRLVGSGPDTLVVLHGGPGFNMEYFAADLEPLAVRHALLFYDQRGAGRSTLVSDSVALSGDRFVDDLEAVRRHFKLHALTLLGHSWGAGLAALYAARFPAQVKRLLIVDGVPLRRSELVAGFTQMDQGRDSTERAQMTRWMDARRAHPEDIAACQAYYTLWFRPFFADPAALGRSHGDFCAGSAAARRNKIQSVDRYTMASLADWDWRSALHAFAAPTLVIHGSVDPLPLVGAREWAATLPHARLLILANVGHFPYLEAPGPFFAAADTFLQGTWPKTAARVASSSVAPTPAASHQPGSDTTASSFGRPAVLARTEGEKRDFQGRRPLWIKVDPQTLGSRSFSAGMEELPPGDSIGVHKHLLEDELVYVARGHLQVTLGDSSHEAETGGLVFIPRGTWIGFHVLGADTATILFMFNTPGFEKCLRFLSAPAGSPFVRPTPEAIAAARHDCHQVRRGEAGQ